MKSARQLHAARSLSRLGESSASRGPILGVSAALRSTAPAGQLRTTPTRQRLAQRQSTSLSLQRSYATHTTPSSAESSSSIPTISPEDTYDIVIIGGANAGLALACALLAKPTLKETARILLIEGGSLERVRTWTGEGPWENRVSSLTAENVAWLESIGVWKNIVDQRSCPVEEMIVWANPSTDSTPSIHFPPLGRPMARMTENTNLQHALLKRIDQVGGETLTIRENSRVSEMQLGPGGRWVGLRIGEDAWVRGSVVVGADGPNSPVRHFSGIDSYGHGYETHAVVATLEHDAPTVYPNNTAFQRFLPTGPLAFLPLSPTASTMVWSTRPDHAAAYKRLSPEALTVMVNAGFSLQEEPLGLLNAQVLGADSAGTPLTAEDISAILHTLPMPPVTTEPVVLPQRVRSIPAKSIASFPLRLSHAEEYLGDRTVLVGDAAHTIHPLAGQGLNMGLADVRVLADVWESARQTGGDLGSLTSMADYPRIRYPANHLMLSTTDKLHYIFRNRAGPINWVRGVGMDVINELGPIKKILMGGAGAGAGMGQKRRTEKEREFGRAYAEDPLDGRAGGWPSALADGMEGWRSLKGALGMAAGMAADVARNGLRRAADALEKR